MKENNYWSRDKVLGRHRTLFRTNLWKRN